MVSLAFHLFVVGTVIFALCSYDCSHPLLCCTVMIWWCVLCFFFSSTICLQVGNPLGFWGGFSCFASFIWCQLFACLIRAAIFRLPPAFVVWSFFLCLQSLSFMAFSAEGIHVRPFVFAMLVLVSGYLSIFGITLCACCSSASFLEIRTGFFSKSVTLWAALQIPLWSKPIWYSAKKFTK